VCRRVGGTGFLSFQGIPLPSLEMEEVGWFEIWLRLYCNKWRQVSKNSNFYSHGCEFSQTFTPALGPAQPRIEWIPGVLS
jgi:hypothetical protein